MSSDRKPLHYKVWITDVLTNSVNGESFTIKRVLGTTDSETQARHVVQFLKLNGYQANQESEFGDDA
jgi:hypothetical protein